MTQQTAPRKSALAASLRRAVIKLTIGMAVIWGTVFIVNQKTKDAPSPAGIEAP